MKLGEVRSWTFECTLVYDCEGLWWSCIQIFPPHFVKPRGRAPRCATLLCPAALFSPGARAVAVLGSPSPLGAPRGFGSLFEQKNKAKQTKLYFKAFCTTNSTVTCCLYTRTPAPTPLCRLRYQLRFRCSNGSAARIDEPRRAKQGNAVRITYQVQKLLYFLAISAWHGWEPVMLHSYKSIVKWVIRRSWRC